MNKIIKYGLIIIKNKKFLINRKFDTKLFLIPGGKPNPGESIEDCLIREINEEHKCTILKDTIVFFGDFEDKAANEPDTIVSMKVYLGKIKGKPIPSHNIEEQKWFGISDDTSILSLIIKNKILPALVEKGLI